MSASGQDAVESEPTDEEVVAAAEALGGEVEAAKESSSESTFRAVVMQCNEALGDETGIAAVASAVPTTTAAVSGVYTRDRSSESVGSDSARSETSPS